MLRVWTKLYNAFNTGQISVLGRATRGCGGAEQQKDRNSITLSPLFTSPPPSLLSHLLSFPHVCLLSISPLLYLLPPFLKSLCTSSPITLIYSQAPSSFISSLLYPLSSIHAPCFPTSRCHLFSRFPVSLSVQSNLQSYMHIQNTFKESDRKYWNTYCSAHKGTQLKLITSFFKQKTRGKCGFVGFNSTFVEQPF